MRATTSLCAKFRKLPLTTKDVNKGYYKGNRTGSMGRHTKYGGYVVDYSKVRTYVVPDLAGFKVRLFCCRHGGRSWGCCALLAMLESRYACTGLLTLGCWRMT